MTNNLYDLSSYFLSEDIEQRLATFAQSLPDGFVVTYTTAVEVGIPLGLGGEGSATTVFQNDGTSFDMQGIAGTLGVGPLPGELAVEIGVAYVGQSAQEALSGFSGTLEGGFAWDLA